MLFNLHTHCNFCDGAGNPEEYVKQALAKGFSVLGFSCHGPAPFTTGWTMEYENTEDYLKTVDSLKTAYKQELQIYKGMEIDYFQGDTRQIFTKYELDYIIGSVHFINAEGENKYYSIDGSLEAFEQTLKMCSDSSIENLFAAIMNCWSKCWLSVALTYWAIWIWSKRIILRIDFLTNKKNGILAWLKT